jgi:hypothetical protein
MAKLTRLNAQSRLVLCKAKVERAKQNLLDMESVLDRYYGHAVGANKHRRSALKGMPKSYEIATDALLAAGDVTNNLWGALDHLCYQLIDAYSPTVSEKVLEQSGFPFGKDAIRYAEAKTRRKVEFMDPRAVTVIDGLRPYDGGNEPLALLNRLNNISKHRVLLTVGEKVYMHADWIGRHSLGTGFLLISTDPHFSGIYDPSEVHQKGDVPHEESLAKFDGAGPNSMLPTLHHLVNVVDSALNEFLPFLDSK